jgi:UDP-N-acetylmuramoyl-tripeptide--D-alanyl-D-alanine ligase
VTLPHLPPPNGAPFTLEEIARATGGQILHSDSSTRIRGVVTDTRLIASTRELEPASTCGPLFVALRGANFDGHNLAPQAIEVGASALLVERELDVDAPQVLVADTQSALGDLARFHRSRYPYDVIPVVAVTGSYGKTTTRALIESALSNQMQILAAQGNFNNEIGLPLTLLRLDESHEAAVLEMGMRGLGQIQYLAEIARPDIAVVTNIGPQHIELLGSLEAIARAKGEIFEALATDGDAIFPDVGEGVEILQVLAGERDTLRFGESESADVRVLECSPLDDGGTHCVFQIGDERIEVNLPLLGAHNAHNAAAALCMAKALGLEMAESARGLENVDVPGARMKLRVLESKKITLIDDCYNAGPNSMRAALQVLEGLPNVSRRMAVLGAMRELGDWSDSEHRKIGQLANGIVQVLVGVGEETKPMLEAAGDIEKHWFKDASEAAGAVQVLAQAGDAILVKGSRSIGLEVVVNALES